MKKAILAFSTTLVNKEMSLPLSRRFFFDLFVLFKDVVEYSSVVAPSLI